MATVNLDIVVRADGSQVRTLRRDLDGLGTTSGNAALKLDVLQAAVEKTAGRTRPLEAEVTKLSTANDRVGSAASRAVGALEGEAEAFAAAQAELDDIIRSTGGIREATDAAAGGVAGLSASLTALKREPIDEVTAGMEALAAAGAPPGGAGPPTGAGGPVPPTSARPEFGPEDEINAAVGRAGALETPTTPGLPREMATGISGAVQGAAPAIDDAAEAARRLEAAEDETLASIGRTNDALAAQAQAAATNASGIGAAAAAKDEATAADAEAAAQALAAEQAQAGLATSLVRTGVEAATAKAEIAGVAAEEQTLVAAAGGIGQVQAPVDAAAAGFKKLGEEAKTAGDETAAGMAKAAEQADALAAKSAAYEAAVAASRANPVEFPPLMTTPRAQHAQEIEQRQAARVAQEGVAEEFGAVLGEGMGAIAGKTDLGAVAGDMTKLADQLDEVTKKAGPEFAKNLEATATGIRDIAGAFASSGNVEVLGKALEDLEKKAASMGAEGKELAGIIGALRAEFAKAENAPEKSGNSVKGFSDTIRHLRYEMLQEQRTVGFFANALNGVIPPGSKAGEALRIFASSMMTIGAPMAAVTIGIEVLGFALKAIPEYFVELEKHHLMLAERSREFGGTYVKAVLQAADAWDQFARSLENAHKSEPERMAAEKEAQYARESRDARLEQMRKTEAMRETPAYGLMMRGFVVPSPYEEAWKLTEGERGVIKAASAGGYSKLTGPWSREDAEALMKRVMPERALKIEEYLKEAGTKVEILGGPEAREKATAAGREIAIAEMQGYGPEIEQAMSRLESVHTSEAAKKTAKDTIAAVGAVIQAEVAREMSRLQAVYGKAAWEKERAPEFDRMIEQNRTRFGTESARVAAENRARLETLGRDVTAGKYGEKGADILASTRAAGEVNAVRASLAEIDAMRAQSRRLEEAQATERHKMVLARLTEEEKLESAVAVQRAALEKGVGNEEALDNAKQALSVHRQITTEMLRQYDLNRDIAHAATMRSLQREVADVGATGRERQIRAAAEAEEVIRERIRVAETKTKKSPDRDKRLQELQEELDETRRRGSTQLRDTDRRIYEQYDAQAAAVRAVAEAERDLQAARDADNISATEQARALATLRARTEDQVDPLNAVARETNREEFALRGVGLAREVDQELLSRHMQLRTQGHPLIDESTKKLTVEGEAVRQQIEAKQRLLRVEQARNEAYQRWNGRAEGLSDRLAGIEQARQKGDITGWQARLSQAEATTSIGQGSFSDGFIRELGLIEAASVRTSQQIGQSFGQAFKGLSEGFADVSAKAILFNDSFEDGMRQVLRGVLSQFLSQLIQIGISYLWNAAATEIFGDAAVTSMQKTAGASMASSAETAAAALIAAKGVAMAITAMAGGVASAWAPAATLVSLGSYGANAIPAMEGIMATFMVAEGIAAMSGGAGVGGAGAGGGAMPTGENAAGVWAKDGGYTGDVPVDEVAGHVHGQEFVINAAATRKNRGLLEEMNRTNRDMSAGLLGAVKQPAGATAVGGATWTAVPGFAGGGYTGSGSRFDPAGVVHGWEFVVNADATARNRATLEALNSGAQPRGGSRSGSMNLTVNVENTISDRAQVQVDRTKDDELRVRLIAREEVHRNAPRVIARDLANPNGLTSRAVTRNTSAERRR